MEKVMLSIITVNHNSSALLKECLSSIVSTIGNDPFEFFVVDSGSKEEDVNNLLKLEGDNVKIILNSENIGYARAVNTGIRNARGDFVLITNPDVIYKPNSIKIMLNAVSKLPQCGAVGPRTWWNKQMTFLLPTGELVSPFWIFKTELMMGYKIISEIILKGWIKKTLRYWLSDKPTKQKILSGACIMTTKRILNTIGGFDETFPLYFEDTDWCLRVRKAGYYLYIVPEANIIHYYSQSAKQDMRSSQEKYNYSLSKYLEKHFKGQLYIINQMQRFCKNSRNKMIKMYNDIGILTSPAVFTFKDGSKKLLLLSPVDSLIPSAGSFFEGNSFETPGDLWDCLGEGRYFVKAFNLDRLKDCGSWSWVKQRPY
ncbi:MAG: glycosyltransferase family 2 protein [Nitrospirota bacterium]